MIGQEASLFAAWLMADGLLGKINQDSHASVAIPIEQRVHDALNASVRGFEANWYGEMGQWPDNDWIIGEMGNGDYYFISRDGSYPGVWQYHHELLEKELISPTLRGFYDYCIEIDREAGNIAA